MPAASPGHPSLGRLALVGVNDPAPTGWEASPRVSLDADPHAALAALRRLLAERTGAVIEMHPSLAAAIAEPGRERRMPHEVGIEFGFDADDVAHLLRGAAVDCRPGATGWWPLQQALALGALPSPDAGADIVLPDGTPAWIDGGPTRYTPRLDGVAVLHRTCIEHGSLVPFDGNDATGIDLADDQRAAVTHHTGAARIIAPAGSGKTRVLTERARHLLQRWRIPASAVTLVAFNKRAEEEMRERTRDLPGIHVRTLNALALAIVNGRPPFAAQPGSLATIDEPEVRRIIGQLVRFPRRRNADPVATWIEALSAARLGLRSPDDVEARYDGEVEGFAAFMPRFRDELRRRQALDYDEQVHRAIEILLAEPAARAAAQRACRLLLVDEFQDLTPAHLLLVRLLAGADASVFGVGDDDQTIYGYNGADPGWLIDFDRHFPGAGDHPLHVNYRCPGGIVRAADTLLRHNARRVPKQIVAARDDADGFAVAGEPGSSTDAGTDTVAATADAVAAAVGRGVAPSDIAVLTRVNSLLAPVQAALSLRGVPTTGGVGSEFLGRASVAASLAWLRLAASGERLDPRDVAEAVRRPSRSLHPRVSDWVGEQSSLDGLRRLADRLNTPRDAATVGEFADDIAELQRLVREGSPTADVLDALHRRTKLDTAIAGLDGHRHGMNRASQFDDVTALAQLALLQPDAASFEPWLARVLGQRAGEAGVVLATVHRVKGQEWPYVVVHHAADDQFPHRLAEDVEEERRLFHVAITRAGRKVLVVPGNQPSPFIAECRTVPTPGRPAATAAASAAARSRDAGSTRPAAAPAGDVAPADAPLFERLRALRRALAAGKPAYVVFPDVVLRDLAARRPSTRAEMARIRGIGPAKLEQYGDAFLAEITRDGTVDADGTRT
ncbi:MAG: ATP-dependent DNA helicase UvrD2 [Ilumatobacteraceae bacterium]